MDRRTFLRSSAVTASLAAIGPMTFVSETPMLVDKLAAYPGWHVCWFGDKWPNVRAHMVGPNGEIIPSKVRLSKEGPIISFADNNGAPRMI